MGHLLHWETPFAVFVEVPLYDLYHEKDVVSFFFLQVVVINSFVTIVLLPMSFVYVRLLAQFSRCYSVKMLVCGNVCDGGWQAVGRCVNESMSLQCVC